MLFNAFEQITPNELAQIIFGKIEYCGIAPLPVFWLLFTLRYAQRDCWLNYRRISLLSAIPLISWVFAIDPWLGLIWKTVEFQTEPFPRILITHGWWFNYVMIPYCYAMMIVGFGVLLSTTFSSSRLYRRQTIILLCASASPFVANVLYVVAGIELYGLDVTPVGFSITCIFIYYGLFRAKFLDVAPVSYKTVFLNTADAVILLDVYQRIVDLNPSAIAESAWSSSVFTAIAQPFNSVFPDYRLLLSRLDESQSELTETIQLPRLPAAAISGQVQNTFREVKVRSLPSPNGQPSGWVVMIRDVTLEKQQQEQLERFAYVDSLTKTLNQHVMLMGHRFALSASIGVAYYPKDGITLQALLRQADEAMYKEKRQRK